MQPYFFPYIGYFQMLNAVDKFILYDSVNYIKKGWISKVNMLNKKGDLILLSVPLQKMSQNKNICDTYLKDYKIYRIKFLKTLQHVYANVPFFSQVYPFLESTLAVSPDTVSKLNYHCLKAVTDKLGIQTLIKPSTIGYGGLENLSQAGKLKRICELEGASTYINSINVRCLYKHSDFDPIELTFSNPVFEEYPQFKNIFVPGLSIIDVLMHCGFDKTSEMVQEKNLEMAK